MLSNPDPYFSVYRLLERVQEQQSSSVLNHRKTMNLISHEIEKATLIDHARTRIFAGFQRMSRFLPQEKRYRKLAQHAEFVYVFGIPDITPPPIDNVIYMALEADHKLAKEWFLVSYGNDYASALATEEQSHIDDPDDKRLFEGIWTFDLGLVSILDQWLTNTVGARTASFNESTHNHARQRELMDISEARITRMLGENITPPMKKELQKMVDTGVYGA